MIIEKPCMFCREVKRVEVPDTAYAAWKAGKYIQDAMPDVSEGDREFLVSNVCSPCFDATFPEDGAS